MFLLDCYSFRDSFRDTIRILYVRRKSQQLLNIHRGIMGLAQDGRELVYVITKQCEYVIMITDQNLSDSFNTKIT